VLHYFLPAPSYKRRNNGADPHSKGIQIAIHKVMVTRRNPAHKDCQSFLTVPRHVAAGKVLNHAPRYQGTSGGNKIL
jgi:hypothetical protein